MRTALGVLLAAALLAVSVGAWSGSGEDVERRDGTRLATLRRHDPLTSTISLGTGEPGHVFSGNGVYNRQSDLEFDHYHEGCFSVGIEGGCRGTIVDLGSATDLAKRYGYSETVGAGQGYASIRFENDRLVIRADAGGSSSRPMRENRILTLEGESCDV